MHSGSILPRNGVYQLIALCHPIFHESLGAFCALLVNVSNIQNDFVKVKSHEYVFTFASHSSVGLTARSSVRHIRRHIAPEVDSDERNRNSLWVAALIEFHQRVLVETLLICYLVYTQVNVWLARLVRI